jgi:hypothetical protein
MPITPGGDALRGGSTRTVALGSFDNLLEGHAFGPFDVLYIPGHADDHLVFVAAALAAFTGDTVLGQGSVFVSGRLREYLAGCAACARSTSSPSFRGTARPVTDPATKLDQYLAHRADRERKLLAALASGASTRTSCSTPRGDDAPEGSASSQPSPCARTWRSCEEDLALSLLLSERERRGETGVVLVAAADPSRAQRVADDWRTFASRAGGVVAGRVELDTDVDDPPALRTKSAPTGCRARQLRVEESSASWLLAAPAIALQRSAGRCRR